jgi:hypothetical protein
MVISSTIFKDLKYQHTWTDATFTYGLNFASLEDANSFSEAMNQAVQKLAGTLAFLSISS